MKKLTIAMIALLLLTTCGSRQRMEQMNALTEQLLTEDSQQVLITSDSIPLLLLDYYTQHGTANQQMRAYYLLARSYDCRDNHFLAIRFYHDAIEKADTAAPDADFVTMSKAYAHSAKMFNMLFGRHVKLAIDDGHQALRCALRGGSEHMARISRELIARAYAHGGELDSTRKYDTLVYLNVFRPWKAPAKMYTFQYPTFLRINHSIPASTSPDKFYVFPIDSIPPAHRAKYTGWGSGLTTIADEPNARDSILSQSNFTSFMNTKLNLQKRMDRQLTVMVAVIILLAGAIVIGILLYRFRRQKTRDAIHRLNTQYSLTLTEYQAVRAELEMLRLNASSRNEEIEAKQRQLDQLRQQIATQQEDKAPVATWDVAEEVTASPILSALHRKAAIGQSATRQELSLLRRTASEQMPAFISELMKRDATLDDVNQLFCILIKLRFLPSEIAVLLDVSSQSVTNRKVRLLKRLFNAEGGAKLFDAEIYRLPARV